MELIKSVVDRIKTFDFNTNECVEYPILDKDGYGVMQSYIQGSKKHFRMHRVSFQVFNNVDVKISDIICHKCDNPKCINPSHLFLGTHKDNSDDKVLKNRQAKGEQNGRYKHGLYTKKNKLFRKLNPKVNTSGRLLTKDIVLKIVDRIKNSGLSQKAISEELNISYSTIRDIASRRVYKEWISQK
jgi:hypothetical protein